MIMDLDIIMPLRVDSKDRALNAVRVAEWFAPLKMIVVQAAPQYSALEFPNNVTCVYLHSNEQSFNKCRAMNFGYKLARNSIVMQIDADCILHPDDLFNAYEKIRTGQCDFAIPHNGHMHDLPRHYHQQLILQQIVNKQIKINDYVKYDLTQTGYGGAFMFNWRAFYNYGMEDEAFSGWGSEEIERWMRLRRFGLEISIGTHPFYHLHHKRPKNGWYNKELEAENKTRAYFWANTDSNYAVLEKVKQLREHFDPGQNLA